MSYGRLSGDPPRSVLWPGILGHFGAYGYLKKRDINGALIRELAKTGAVGEHFGLCVCVLARGCCNVLGSISRGIELTFAGEEGGGDPGCRSEFVGELQQRHEMLRTDIFIRLGTGQRPGSARHRGCVYARVFFCAVVAAVV